MCDYEDDLLAVAKRLVWFEPPEQALGQRLRFLAYVMTYATLEEILVVQKYFSEGTLGLRCSMHLPVSLIPAPGIIGTSYMDLILFRLSRKE